jgi:predicted dehydrogenase
MMGIEHIKNIALVEGAELVAFADPHEESRRWARLVAGEGPAEHADSRALLDDPQVDAVVIASPNHTHRAVLEDAFASGKHLLVEKPLCTTVEDAKWVATRAAAHPGVVWTAMEYRYMPPVARLLDELHSGTVGRLQMFAIREHRFPFLPKVGHWNRFARNTGGTLVEKCCHFFDLMRLAVSSEAVRVYASGGMDVNHLDERYDGERPDILDNAYVIVDFANGVRALLDLCMFAEGSRNQEEVVATGDRGKLECFVPESSLVIGRRSPRKIERFEIPVDPKLLAAGFHHGSTYYQHERFFAAVTRGAPVEVTAEDGLRAVEIGAAAERSVTEGCPVALEGGR